MTDERTDEQLLRDHVAGSHDAFAELVARHERRAFAIALRMTGRDADAEDATQEAFLSVLRGAAAFRGDARFTTWFHRIVVNASYDALRRRERAPMPVEDDALLATISPVGDRTAEVESSIDIARALTRVPEEHRAVLILHDVHDLGFDEIGEVLGIPVGTAKSRLHRGRVALARALTGGGDGPGASGPVAGEPDDRPDASHGAQP